jgi:hypothetical protein
MPIASLTGSTAGIEEAVVVAARCATGLAGLLSAMEHLAGARGRAARQAAPRKPEDVRGAR